MTKVPDPQKIEDIETAIDNMTQIVADIKNLVNISGDTRQYGKPYYPIQDKEFGAILGSLEDAFRQQIQNIFFAKAKKE